MEKEKVMMTFFRYNGKPVQAKREVSYEMKLQAQLILDEICFHYNKSKVEADLNRAIDDRNESDFKRCSDIYKEYIWK